MGCSSGRGQQPKIINEEIPDTKTPGFSGIYHKVGVKELIYSPFPGV